MQRPEPFGHGTAFRYGAPISVPGGLRGLSYPALPRGRLSLDFRFINFTNEIREDWLRR